MFARQREGEAGSGCIARPAGMAGATLQQRRTVQFRPRSLSDRPVPPPCWLAWTRPRQRGTWLHAHQARKGPSPLELVGSASIEDVRPSHGCTAQRGWESTSLGARSDPLRAGDGEPAEPRARAISQVASCSARGIPRGGRGDRRASTSAPYGQQRLHSTVPSSEGPESTARARVWTSHIARRSGQGRPGFCGRWLADWSELGKRRAERRRTREQTGAANAESIGVSLAAGLPTLVEPLAFGRPPADSRDAVSSAQAKGWPYLEKTTIDPCAPCGCDQLQRLATALSHASQQLNVSSSSAQPIVPAASQRPASRLEIEPLDCQTGGLKLRRLPHSSSTPICVVNETGLEGKPIWPVRQPAPFLASAHPACFEHGLPCGLAS